jgi:hypothetical protein
MSLFFFICPSSHYSPPTPSAASTATTASSHTTSSPTRLASGPLSSPISPARPVVSITTGGASGGHALISPSAHTPVMSLAASGGLGTPGNTAGNAPGYVTAPGSGSVKHNRTFSSSTNSNAGVPQLDIVSAPPTPAHHNNNHSIGGGGAPPTPSSTSASSSHHGHSSSVMDGSSLVTPSGPAPIASGAAAAAASRAATAAAQREAIAHAHHTSALDISVPTHQPQLSNLGLPPTATTPVATPTAAATPTGTSEDPSVPAKKVKKGFFKIFTRAKKVPKPVKGKPGVATVPATSSAVESVPPGSVLSVMASPTAASGASAPLPMILTPAHFAALDSDLKKQQAIAASVAAQAAAAANAAKDAAQSRRDRRMSSAGREAGPSSGSLAPAGAGSRVRAHSQSHDSDSGDRKRDRHTVDDDESPPPTKRSSILRQRRGVSQPFSPITTLSSVPIMPKPPRKPLPPPLQFLSDLVLGKPDGGRPPVPTKQKTSYGIITVTICDCYLLTTPLSLMQ